MPDLADFQEAFCRALEGDAEKLSPWSGSPDEPAGLSIYRNTIVKGSADVLAATYETVVQLVGEDWFRAAAGVFVRSNPPASPSMLTYGGNFPEWLAGFEPAQDLPYLPDVARLDWLAQEAYFARDAEPLPVDALTPLSAEVLSAWTFRLHPSLHLASFEQNVVSLWLAHRGPQGLAAGFELLAAPEHAMVLRPALTVEVRRIDPAAYAFLSACRAGEDILSAAERALEIAPEADLAQTAADLLCAGAFAGLSHA